MQRSELGTPDPAKKAMRKTFVYDVFLSHNSKDKPAVRALAERLKQDGLRVWFDEWVIQPGDLISLKIEQGLEQLRTLILVMSHNAFASEWVTLERHTALFRDPTNAERRFIPLRLDDAEITDTLKQFAYIDWRQKAQEQYARLLTACRPVLTKTNAAGEQRQQSPAVKVLKGHTDKVLCVAITADRRRAVSGSVDQTVRVWDLEAGQCLATLQGHTDAVCSVAVTADGQRAVSGSSDQTVQVWDLPPIARKARQAGEATRYTNAKVLLVGDSGVGKSGLAYRLTEDRFVATISTDGTWATQLKLPHDTNSNDIEREIWLWDFAGQADYRLIHQLYMDETALAVLIFNPQSENPFEGLGQWDRNLARVARRSFQKLLVAGRCDRGGLMVSRESIERFHRERGFAAYLETSAYTGAGCQELREAIVRSIPWTDIAWRSSPRIFKVLKDAIVKLKDEGKVLLRMAELKQQLDMRLPGEQFTLDELRAVVGLLAGPGVVWQLDFGDFVLLQPERINAYATAVIRSVRAHTEEIGCISEERVLAGDLDYQDMQQLPLAEEEIVLRAMHQTFVDYGLCLRERADEGTLLVFPSYFRRRERPDLEDHPAVFVSYQFSGVLDEIYATLVVRLHHTLSFDTDQLWRFAADFKTPSGKRVGLKMTKRGEGAAELVVYFELGVPDDVKVTFIRYVHEHLQRKTTDVMRLRYYVCPHCHTPVENRRTALERLNRGLKDIVCVNCEQRIPLWDLIEEKFASSEFQQRVRALEEQAMARIDNESRELILVGHAFAIAGEAGQIFRPTPNSDWGIDGEIEFTAITHHGQCPTDPRIEGTPMHAHGARRSPL